MTLSEEEGVLTFVSDSLMTKSPSMPFSLRITSHSAREMVPKYQGCPLMSSWLMSAWFECPLFELFEAATDDDALLLPFPAGPVWPEFERFWVRY